MTGVPLSLYIHLPWCERKCPYCDFNSHTSEHIPERPYIDELLRDLEWGLARSGDRTIKTVFIGGGTPSLFSGEAIQHLLDSIRAMATVANDAEVTMESNPGSAEADKFRAFRAAGVNRLSLGIQSFHDEHLTRLGRVHNAHQAHRAIDMALEAGFERINVDLMHGLEQQTEQEAVADIEQALRYPIHHLSWYQLTIEPNTVFYRTQPVLPVEDRLATIQARGEETLGNAGFNAYEVSAWARQDQHCRHNLNYWSFGDYIALGAGAHGKLSDNSSGEVLRYWQTRQPQAYLERSSAEPAGSRRLSDEDLRFEFVLNSLRLREGFSLKDYSQRTGLAATSLQPELTEAIERGLLTSQAGRIATTALGLRFLDSVTGLFLPD